jgi:hypothetical protein
MALMDFIWDKNGNTLRKTAYWWGDSMTNAAKTQVQIRCLILEPLIQSDRETVATPRGLFL